MAESWIAYLRSYRILGSAVFDWFATWLAAVAYVYYRRPPPFALSATLLPFAVLVVVGELVHFLLGVRTSVTRLFSPSP